jgi:hypothetical protein
VGETYLFVLHQFETGLPAPLNIDQSVFNLQNPFTKHAPGMNVLLRFRVEELLKR